MQIRIVCIFLLSSSLAHAQTIEALRGSCAGGNGEACNSIGKFHELGKGGFPKDLIKATEFYEKACKAGYENACHTAGLFYETGFMGITADPSKAAVLFEKACDSDVFMACVSLAYKYTKGRGVALNKAKARELCQKVLENDPGDPDCKKIVTSK